MDDQQFPKVHVVEQWVGGSGMLCVELVEIAVTRMQQLLGGQTGFRIRLIESGGENTLAFIVSEGVVTDLCDLLEKARKKHEELNGKKSE